MIGSQLQSGSAASAPPEDADLLEDAPTLLDQLTQDPSGRRLAEILEELSVAAATIEAALAESPRSAHTPVLRDLLGAIRLGESLVTETWNSMHA
jgi:ABC-type transporter Mla subunit MlaD